MDNFLVLLLSAGGAAFLTAVVAGLRSFSNSRLESESALIKRLNDSAVQSQKEADRQRLRADRLEKQLETMRDQRDDALDKEAQARRRLLENGLSADFANDQGRT